jgi:glycerol-3-phosphate acyltransferase PlsY
MSLLLLLAYVLGAILTGAWVARCVGGCEFRQWLGWLILAFVMGC